MREIPEILDRIKEQLGDCEVSLFDSDEDWAVIRVEHSEGGRRFDRAFPRFQLISSDFPMEDPFIEHVKREIADVG